MIKGQPVLQVVAERQKKKERNLSVYIIHTSCISHSRSSIVVTVPLPQNLYRELPAEFHESGGQAISVHPIMFNVGMNEEQSLAEL